MTASLLQPLPACIRCARAASKPRVVSAPQELLEEDAAAEASALERKARDAKERAEAAEAEEVGEAERAEKKAAAVLGKKAEFEAYLKQIEAGGKQENLYDPRRMITSGPGFRGIRIEHQT